LGDDEIDQIDPNIDYDKVNVLNLSSDDLTRYDVFEFAEARTGGSKFTSLAGESTNNPFTDDFGAYEVKLLNLMIDHMFELQAGLERIRFFKRDINYEVFFRRFPV
jgi:hypothetical protein